MFYENLHNACKKQNTSPTAIVKKLHLSSGNVTNWKNGATPNADILIQLSKLLQVSCDFLLTGHDAELWLSNDETLLLNGYRSMNEEGKEYIMQTLDMAKERYKKGTESVFSAEDKAI